MQLDRLNSTLETLNRAPVIVASHPRSGTHLVIDVLRKHFTACRGWKWPGESVSRLYLDLDATGRVRRRLSSRTAVRILARAARPVVKTHILPWGAWWLQDGLRSGTIDRVWLDWMNTRGKYIYVHRDGRDVMSSFYLFLKSYHPAVVDVTLPEFLRQSDHGRSRVAAWAWHVRSWLEKPAVTVLSYRDFFHNLSTVIGDLAAELDIAPKMSAPALPTRFRSRWNRRIARLLCTQSECTAIHADQKGHPRLDWRQQFTREDREFFNNEAGSLLIQLGYEDGESWVHDDDGQGA